MPLSSAGLQERLISRRGVYRYILPHPQLRPYIAHYTLTLPGRSGLSRQLTLLPDASGCMVFGWRGQGLEGHFWGPTTRAATVENDLDQVLRFFVEFLPCGAFVLTGLPQAELCDRRLSLAAVDPAAWRELSAALLESRDAGELAARADRFFLRRLQESRADEAEKRLCRLIDAQPGPHPAGELAAQLGYSPRHLGRIARPVLGMGPGTYGRICRFNRAVCSLRAFGGACARLCQEAGYYDQPHFIHDFKLVTGKTPTQYLQSLSDFYNEELKFPAIL